MKPLLSGHLRDLSKFTLNRGCPLNEGCKNCAMFATFNGCAVIKLHFVKEAIESSSSLPFITNFNLFLNVKILTDYSTYFKDVIVNSVRCPLNRGF